MRIVRIELRNFRCLRDLQIDFDPLTVLVGPNGSGKSSLLRSLEFLFGRYEIDDDDCWGGDRTLAVEITATFADAVCV